MLPGPRVIYNRPCFGEVVDSGSGLLPPDITQLFVIDVSQSADELHRDMLHLFTSLCSACRNDVQIWRPATSATDADDDASYRLIGQTFIRLTELRFHEISLPPSSRLKVARGDVLGLYYPGSNPVGWSTVPCASASQRHRFVSRSSREPLIVGDVLRFKRSPAGHDACRQYSFAALFGNSRRS